VDFSLSQEQRLMQDELARALARISPLERVRAATQATTAAAAAIWDELVSLGIPGLIVDPKWGGLGLGVLDAALVAEQLGRFVVPAPFIGSVVLGPMAVAIAGTPQQQAEYLPRLASGTLRAAVGISDAAAGTREGSGVREQNGRLSGSALFVVDHGGADIFIVGDGEKRLHLVHRGAPGLELTPLQTVDRTREVCKLDFADVPCDALPEDPGGAIARMRNAGRVVLAGDTLGAGWRMLEKAVDYAGQRRQFGRLIGSFQAVKHMCAEMAAELEPGRALLWYAGYAQDQRLQDACLVAAHAKAYLSDAGRMVARKSIEVHGGIGITDELGLHLWFKRIGWNHQLLGSPERLRQETAEMQDHIQEHFEGSGDIASAFS
jgi:alkylation response protein AidB-like acyl-CoA dehydrogenase